jgi:glycosyltransferase involved in cell wall biosynthesis
MNIGNYVSVVSGQKGFENNVSGHIQIPLHAMSLLKDAGHQVHLVTNEFGPERSLPNCMPDNIPIHYVIDARRRGGILERTGEQSRGVRPGQFLKQLRQMKAIAKREKFDVFHFFGFNRTGHLAGILRLSGMKCPTVMTTFKAIFPERMAPVTRFLWRRVDVIATATDYVQEQYRQNGITTQILRHGLVRDITAELGDEVISDKHRVLFWRDPSVDNGADVVMDVYDVLAPKYPKISFDLAVRPHWKEIPNLEERASKHKNVHVYRFPYEDGITLPKLMLESLCVLMPIRNMSIDPQLVIAESLAAGVPVIATDKNGNGEMITPGRSGYLIAEGNVKAGIEALDSILSNHENALAMGHHAKQDISERFNWNTYVDEVVKMYQGVL